MVRVLEQRLPAQRDLDVRWQRVALAQVAKLRQLPAERALVRNRHPVRPFRSAGHTRTPKPTINTRQAKRSKQLNCQTNQMGERIFNNQKTTSSISWYHKTEFNQFHDYTLNFLPLVLKNIPTGVQAMNKSTWSPKVDQVLLKANNSVTIPFGGSGSRILKGGGAGVVIDEVVNTIVGDSHLPSGRKRIFLVHPGF